MKKFKLLVMMFATMAASSFSSIHAETWSYNWSLSKSDGGAGFYNTTAPDTLSTTINEWSWMATGTSKYLYTAGGGQSLGSANAYASHVSLFTYDAPGAISEVSIKARRQKDSEEATMQVSVNGIAYVCDASAVVYLTTDSLLYTFKPTAEAQSGKLDIEFFQNKEKKNVLFIKSIKVEYSESKPTVTKTWSFGWDLSKTNGGEGIYNFSSSFVDQDTITATINGLTWSAYTDNSKTYSYTSSSGQMFGKATDNPSFTSFFTYDVKGKITAVRIKARHAGKEGQAVYMKVSTNGISYQCADKDSVNLTGTVDEYEFKPTTDAQMGKLDIEFFQPSDVKNIYYMRAIEIDYEMEAAAVSAPVFSLASGTYDSVQICSITVPEYEAGTYTIYYTLDGTSPKGNGVVYTEPVKIAATSKLKAVAKKDDNYSDIIEADYVIRVSPEFKFEKDTMYIEAPDNGYSPYPNSKFYVSNITFKSSDPSVCAVSPSSGVLYSIKPGVCTISACFAGNDKYLPDTASYTLIVTQKAPLPCPVLDPMGGTFDAPVEVNISVTGDDRAMAIWYSMTAKDSAELTDEPIIIKATSGTIKIKKSCKLLVLAAGENVFSPLVEADYIINEKLTASFGADESETTYYKQGFDSLEEIADWKLYNTSRTTFRLMEEPTLRSGNSFSSIDPDNQHSLNIQYSSYEKQAEIFESPAMKIKPNSSVEFYSFFSGGMLYFANWYLSIYDETTGKETDLVNAFEWAQKNAYTGPAWIRFNCDLSEYEDHELYFAFVYEGQDGEDVAFDGFKLKAMDLSDSAKIIINEGESVHFHDQSTKATSIKWEFPGGIVTNEDVHNPIVTYNEAGTYDVMLIVTNGTESDTLIRKNYVEVKAEMPKAIAGLPEEGYLSPYTGVFVPCNVPVTFRDLSKGHITERQWYFNGTDIETSNEANPVVTYTKAGTFSCALQVANNIGKDVDQLNYAIQAGGAQYIWNIAPEENSSLANIPLGFYGYYAGTNWLDIYAFAEKFKAPLAPATIDSVSIFFDRTFTVTPDTAIVVKIHKADAQGMPGEVLASGSLKASQLLSDEYEIVATTFVLDKTAEIDGEFFVSVSGIPNNGNNDGEDDIAILCYRRGYGEKNTAYQYQAEFDGYYPTGESAWYANTDDPLSMAIAPVLSYGIPEAIGHIKSPTIKTEQIFNLNGLRVENAHAGLYIIDGKKVMVK